MSVHFYDVGEALAVLVSLPDGRHVLVDTGDGARRPGCGELCEAWSEHLLGSLGGDLRVSGSAERTLDMLWITHQHADHVGGAAEVMDAFRTGVFVDNGRDPNKPEVRRARRAAAARATRVVVVDPEHREVPLPASAQVRFTAVVPPAWPGSCARDPNECSIGLRVDYCDSSVLFTGDAEHEEEGLLDTGGPVTLLQVAHHGSETSSSPAFLARTKPRYAVISAGKPGEGYNRAFCHPRATIVSRLSRVLGDRGARGVVGAFDGDRCENARREDWVPVPSSAHLWATERDGDVVLTTNGDGVFRREGP